jgi:inorganic pyrophosphatase
VRAHELEAFVDREKSLVRVVVETPKGSRNKYALDEETGLYALRKVLPAGASFPYDFGFVPSTIGGDGDPLDVLLLLDEPCFPGCLVEARLVGVIEAEQEERGKTKSNDRLIAVAAASQAHGEVRGLDDLPARLLDEVEHFFTSYHAARGVRFTPKRRAGPTRAREVVDRGVESARGRSATKRSSAKQPSAKQSSAKRSSAKHPSAKHLSARSASATSARVKRASARRSSVKRSSGGRS